MHTMPGANTKVVICSFCCRTGKNFYGNNSIAFKNGMMCMNVILVICVPVDDHKDYDGDNSDDFDDVTFDDDDYDDDEFDHICCQARRIGWTDHHRTMTTMHR